MIETLARLGYASKALIYAIVGTLAIAAAANRGGQVTDTSGALKVVLTQPFGRALLVVLAIGLCGYAAWRLLDAVADPDRHGTTVKGLVTRIGNAVRGIVYGALAFEAFGLLRGLGGSDGHEAEAWASRLMNVPLGSVALVVVGAIVAAYGVSEVVDSVTLGRDRLIDLSPVPPATRKPLHRVMKFGVGARGLIIITLGVFLVRAGIRERPADAAGTRESIVELASVVEGRWLLLLIACGLLAYAVDQAVHAWCRRIRPVL
jgi:hypothetical protein